MKITSAGDVGLAEARLIRDLQDIRTGQGYDVHALRAGRPCLARRGENSA